MRLSIVGIGYVGLVTAACLAAQGHNIICVDNNEEKIKTIIRQKTSLIYENGLEVLLRKNWDKFRFTSDISDALDVDAVFLTVGTPEKKDGSANLNCVWQVVKQISEKIKSDTIVVIKSTVPIGTGDKIARYFMDNCIHNVVVISNPEFLSQGTAISDTLNASRIVIGAENKNDATKVQEIYKGFDSPIQITDRCTAEMIKYASNDFLALKISYINEIANLCEDVGANIEDVARGMGYDKRIGSGFLKAGIGYGGSCFPKDTRALHWLSNFHDHEIKTIKAAIEVNESQKLRLIKKARKYYTDFEGLTVAALGLSFKPGTDDLRDAPSVDNVSILLEEGANVNVFDPIANANFEKLYGDKVIYCNTINEAVLDADICFIFTEWPVIVNYNVKNYVEFMKKPIVIDGRNCYDLNIIKDVAIIYESIGRRCINGIMQCC